jgi:hypothetical protein
MGDVIDEMSEEEMSIGDDFALALMHAKEEAEEPVRAAARELGAREREFLSWMADAVNGQGGIRMGAMAKIFSSLEPTQRRVTGALRALKAARITADEVCVEIAACEREYEASMKRGLPVGRDHRLPD